MADTVTPPTLSAGRHGPSIAVFFAVALLLLAADLVTKHLAFERVAGEPIRLQRVSADQPAHLPPHPAVTLVPRILSLKLTLNQGAVFGLGKGGQWLFIAVSLIAVPVIVRLFWRSFARAYVLHGGLGLILGGALGNLYDRVRFNAVRDLLWLFPGVKLPFGLTWPGDGEIDELYPWIFNIADAALLVGIVTLLILTWRGQWSVQDAGPAVAGAARRGKRQPGDQRAPG